MFVRGRLSTNIGSPLTTTNRVFDPPEEATVTRFSRFTGPSGKRVKDQTFGFDRVFDDNTTQGDVYESTTRNLLDSVLDGYNATVFAYGATGCGKTHTITYVDLLVLRLGGTNNNQWNSATAWNHLSHNAGDF